MSVRFRSLLVIAALLFGGSLLLLAASQALVMPDAQAQEIDEEFPPGDPVIGDNPVMGSSGPGENPDDTNYAAWVLVAVCLIVAGLILVRLERWERNRSGAAGER